MFGGEWGLGSNLPLLPTLPTTVFNALRKINVNEWLLNVSEYLLNEQMRATIYDG